MELTDLLNYIKAQAGWLYKIYKEPDYYLGFVKLKGQLGYRGNLYRIDQYVDSVFYFELDLESRLVTKINWIKTPVDCHVLPEAFAFLNALCFKGKIISINECVGLISGEIITPV